ncbi:PREDICTED: CD81 antigen-like [Priapulus caudatus]|uniref:Tetraspanin n=1 Tax=Priapulus caudatus TaxID=37621 RepID=A0ABM1DQT7_PRICU|nr:PREDICTED: CD81 antigen-like [Priapulus caudatus]
MGLTGCMRCLKYTVFVINLLFWLAGMALLGLALWLRFNPQTDQYTAIDEQLSARYYTASYILMAAGGVMTMFGFLGCYGALRESQCILIMFFTLLVLLFAAEIGGGIYAYMNKEKLSAFAKEAMKKTIKYEYGRDPIQTSAVDYIQDTLSCCGGENADDWISSHWSTKDVEQDIGVGEKQLVKVPSSCCTVEGKNSHGVDCGNFQKNEDPLLHGAGCSPSLGTYFRENLDVVVGAGVSIAIFQFLGMVLAIMLCCSIRRDGYEPANDDAVYKY